MQNNHARNDDTVVAFDRRQSPVAAELQRGVCRRFRAEGYSVVCELSLANGRDKSSLTPVVEDLVRRGLVERRRMDEDRRAYRLNLTTAGQKTLASMIRAARGHERVLDSIIGGRDRARFVEVLKRIAAQVK